MFLTKILVTLLLIQSLQLTFAQDDDDFGQIESLPRFEARRQSSLSGNGKDEFEYDDNSASQGPVNPLPARSGRNQVNNEDDYDENQAPQSSSSVNAGAGSTKGRVLVSNTGKVSPPRLTITREPQVNTFIAPLPVQPVVVTRRPTPVAPVPVATFTQDSSGSLSTNQLPATKTVRVVKTARVFRPDQSGSLSTGIKGGVKSSQVLVPSVTRFVRPVVIPQRPTTTLVTPVVQPVAPLPLPVTSGSAGPSQVVSRGVKTVSISGNSKVQPPRLRVITTQRPTVPAFVDADEDEDAASGPSSSGQFSGVKTIAAANPVPLVPLAQFTPTRTLVQPVRQPARLEVIYADDKLGSRDQDEDGEDENAAGLSSSGALFNRVPIRTAPQPYLVPLNIQAPRPVQQVFSSQGFQSTGKTNTIKSSFVARPQPVAQTLVQVAPAPAPVRPNPQPILIETGSKSVAGVKGSVTRVQPAPIRVFTTRRPQTVQVVDEENEDDSAGVAAVSGVKGSRIIPSTKSIVRPVLVRATPAPIVRPLVQVREEPLPTFQQFDLVRTQPPARPVVITQQQIRPAPVQPIIRVAPQPAPQPIIQIREGAAPAEFSRPPSRPIQVVQKVQITPAPTVRPITQITQIREPALPKIQISQPRLIQVAPTPQVQVTQISEPARPLTQVRESTLVFQPLDPALRPSVPQPTVQVTQVQSEVTVPRPVQPIQPIRFEQRVTRVQQPSVVETVQVKESPISQSNLGVQREFQPQPAPQPIEILRLREPSFTQFPVAPRQPQAFIAPRPRLVPAPLPTISQTRPVVQISQEKEVTLSQSVAPAPIPAPAPAPVLIQQQRRVVSTPVIQQVQTNTASVSSFTNARPITSEQVVIRSPQPTRVFAPLQSPQVTQVTSGFQSQSNFAPWNRVQLTQQAPRPTFQPQPQQTLVVSQPRPAQEIVQEQQQFRPAQVIVQQQQQVRPAQLIVQQPRPSQVFVQQQQQVRPAQVIVQQPRPSQVFVQQQKQVRPAQVIVQQQQQVRPAQVIVQQQQQVRPAQVFVQQQQQVRPAQVIVQQQPRPLLVQSNLSQSREQQFVQIREKVPDEIEQIEQVRLARA